MSLFHVSERLYMQIYPKSEQMWWRNLPQMKQKPPKASDSWLKICLLKNFKAEEHFNENFITTQQFHGSL